MWLCLNEGNLCYGMGKTPQEAYKDYDTAHGADDTFDSYTFYEVSACTPMKQVIVPVEVIIPLKTKETK